MIFASDLDRTLIYSNRFLEEVPMHSTIVEHRQEKPFSHMTDKSISLLRAINERIIFVPTTTRSMEQFNRINIFHGLIPTKYAVVANGGIILIHGKPHEEWKKIIETKMQAMLTPGSLMERFKQFFEDKNVTTYKCCDDIFVYADFKNNNLDDATFSFLKMSLQELGYSLIKNGRKLYMLPAFLNKLDPIKYIMKLENEDKFIAAGDSELDLPMLINSDLGFIPIHGELHTSFREVLNRSKHIHFTNNHGITSSDEFLKEILEMIS